MKRKTFFCVIFLMLFSQAFPGLLTTFPDMIRPLEIHINAGKIYISDQSSVFVYDARTFKLVKKLCDKGEGPQQLKTNARIAFSNDRLILYDPYKMIIYTKDFILQKEINLANLGNSVVRVMPIEENFILPYLKRVDNKMYQIFNLYNNKLEKIKDISCELQNEDNFKYLIAPFSIGRSFDKNAFIAHPQKGFYIEVYNKNGEKLYQIEKKLSPIKSTEKHRQANIDELKYFLSNNSFEKFKARGNFNRPMKDYMPALNNFWVFDNFIYVKTYDITSTKEKYIIMDLKGNILKEIFLPKVPMELLTFVNNTFYYLEDSEAEECWALYSIDINEAVLPTKN